jgi:tRNA-dihydrouridine synthase
MPLVAPPRAGSRSPHPVGIALGAPWSILVGMERNFWQELPRPIFALAPMEDVTDTVFRQIVLSVSDPRWLHVVCAEFASTDGLCHPAGRPKVAERLHVDPGERELLRRLGVKLVAQIWGSRPEKFHEAARLICTEMDFDGIDINMGCPVRKIVKQSGCSALIGQPALAKEIVLATKEAADVPVSVKTRTGLREVVTESWIGALLETEPAAIILHGRTQKQMSRVPADWLEIARAVRVRDACGHATPVLGNGDVASVADALQKIEQSGVDGVMVGRGVLQDVWFFNHPACRPSKEDRLELLQRHTRLYAETWGGRKNFNILKKFYKIYCSGFPGSAELRKQLMQARDAAAIRNILGF